jgi:hypothetical protein
MVSLTTAGGEDILLRVNFQHLSRDSNVAFSSQISDTQGRLAPKKKQSEKRNFRRTRGQGPQSLTLTHQDADGRLKTSVAKLYDFSDGGLGMDAPRAFQPGEIFQVNGTLRGPVYSMEIDARVRVAYCRKIDTDVYRVGVAFLDVSYRRIAED